MDYNKKKPKALIVEGNIGVGKSTFLKIIQSSLDVEVVFEPNKKWQDVHGDNLLDKFYKDTKRWAYTFQTYAFVTRVLEQEESAKLSVSEFQVLERSVYSDRYCFAKNCFELEVMSSLEWELYKEWFSWLVGSYVSKPQGFIYLKSDPEICYERLKKRNRFEESAVPLDYLKMLHNKHEDWLISKKEVDFSLKDLPVLVLDANKDFVDNIAEQQKHIQSIVDFFGIKYKS